MSQAMTWYQLSDAGMACFDSAPLSSDSEQTMSPMMPPTLRGLAYGDGFFTTIGVYNGQIINQKYHHSRVLGHCQALYMHLSVDRQQQLWQAIGEFAADMQHGIIKIIISRTAQKLRGYAYSTNLYENDALVWVGVMPSAPLASQTAQFLDNTHSAQTVDNQHQEVILQQLPIVAGCLQSQLASFPAPIAGLKTLNRLDGVMISGELERLKQAHPDVAEGLVQDMNGNWVEGVMSNVFYQLKNDSVQKTDKQWYTPPIASSGVDGTMRQAIIHRFNATEQPVILRPLRDEDLANIKSMFFCNAVRGVMPVEKLILGNQRLELSLSVFAI